MAFLRGEKVGCNRSSAGIVEFLRVRFRLALHGVDIAEVGVGPVGPVDPKARCRISLADVSSPEKVLDSGVSGQRIDIELDSCACLRRTRGDESG